MGILGSANRVRGLLWVALVIGLQGAALPAMGQTIEREMRDELRVCADENLLPYSDRAGAGFENRLAEMIAADLDIPVTYTWWPQTIGFLRNTLYERECDVVLGITEGHGRVLNTNPYYRSVYCAYPLNWSTVK